MCSNMNEPIESIDVIEIEVELFFMFQFNVSDGLYLSQN